MTPMVAKPLWVGQVFLLNDEMDDFSVKPGVPNMYGAIGGTANAIQPNKRMLSAMTPTIILKDKKLDFSLKVPFNIVALHSKNENWQGRTDSNCEKQFWRLL